LRGFVLGCLRFEEKITEAIEEKDGEDSAVKKRQAVIGFDEPIVVNDAANCRNVDEAMKQLPTLAAEATNPVFRGSEGEWNQQEETEKADGNERALVDVFPHAAKVKGLIGTEIGKEVEADIEEGEKSEHATKANEVGELEEFAEGSDGEGDEEEADGPVAGKVLHEFDGIGGELAIKATCSEKAERGKASEENEGLGPFAGEELAELAHVSSIFSGPCRCKGWPPGRRTR
jgi:predicted nuclease with RNAse H fold